MESNGPSLLRSRLSLVGTFRVHRFMQTVDRNVDLAYGPKAFSRPQEKTWPYFGVAR